MPNGIRTRARQSAGRAIVCGLLVALSSSLFAQTAGQGQKPTPPAGQGQKPAAPAGNSTPVVPVGVPVTPDYVIGPEDVLTVVVWKEADLSGDVTVRPDGKISMPLLNDIDAAGLTPEQLRARITEAAKKYLEEPTVTVVVKTINSRKVFVTGQVAKPGTYPIAGPTTVLQLLALAGGVLEWAAVDRIVVLRTENGRSVSFPFNYKEVTRRRNLEQNILLKPGDTVVVPD